MSFNGNKIITTGGGGAIVTNDEGLARRAKHLTTTAKLPHPWEFVHDEIGFNFRLPSLNAALGCAQIEQLAERLIEKRRLAQRYIEAFSDINGARIFKEPAGAQSNYWLNTMLLDERFVEKKDEVIISLRKHNIYARPAWTLIHKLPMYSRHPRANLDVAEKLGSRIINIPSSARLGGRK